LFFLFIQPSFAVEIWNSASGINKLQTSQYKNDFYQLANFYQPQINPLYCAVATATTMINAFNYPNIDNQINHQSINPNGDIIPFNLYSQDDFLNKQTDQIKEKDVIEYKKAINNQYDPGIGLQDFAKILQKVHKLKAKVYHQQASDDSALQIFRQHLQQHLADQTTFVVANFDGSLIGNKTKGHLSLLAAYNQDSDDVLVLDVALHKNLWYWVNANDLLKAMNSKDGDNYRGYILVSKK